MRSKENEKNPGMSRMVFYNYANPLCALGGLPQICAFDRRIPFLLRKPGALLISYRSVFESILLSVSITPIQFGDGIWVLFDPGVSSIWVNVGIVGG
jgi:hypothetical protein